MAGVKKAVFDTGHLIHLDEVNQLSLLRLFEDIKVSIEVAEELKSLRVKLLKHKNVKIKGLQPGGKDFARYLVEMYGLDIGEATSISLCKQEKIRLFFTDDLEAREIAHSLGFEPHGTLAIVLRSFGEKLSSKKQAIGIVKKLYEESSLFITRDLVEWVVKEIEKFCKGSRYG